MLFLTKNKEKSSIHFSFVVFNVEASLHICFNHAKRHQVYTMITFQLINPIFRSHIKFIPHIVLINIKNRLWRIFTHQLDVMFNNHVACHKPQPFPGSVFCQKTFPAPCKLCNAARYTSSSHITTPSQTIIRRLHFRCPTIPVDKA